MQSDRRWSPGAQFRTYNDVEGRAHAWGRALHDRGLYGDKRPAALLPTHLKGFLLRQHLAPAHAQPHIAPCAHVHGHARLDDIVCLLGCRSCKHPLQTIRSSVALSIGLESWQAMSSPFQPLVLQIGLTSWLRGISLFKKPACGMEESSVWRFGSSLLRCRRDLCHAPSGLPQWPPRMTSGRPSPQKASH